MVAAKNGFNVLALNAGTAVSLAPLKNKDASVGVNALDNRWALQLWGRNITDTYYWTSVASNANVVVRFPGMAPTYGASLTFNY